MATVEIHVSGGVAHLVGKPDDVKVIIRDYDVDGVDESVLTKDDDGDYYQEMVFE